MNYLINNDSLHLLGVKILTKMKKNKKVKESKS